MAAEQVPFRLVREVGSGASGRVWQAVLLRDLPDCPAGTQLAVKLIHPHLHEHAELLRQVDNEVRAGMAVRHPAVVRVYATGDGPEGRWLAMQWVGGPTLRTLLEEAQGALAEPRVRAILRRAYEGLAALHAAHWMHGDIKPENIRLDEEGQAVLLDLGFARRTDQPAQDRRPGSIAYLAPEMARGSAGDAASDVFALAVVGYELATGVHPFVRAAATQVSSRSDMRDPLFDSLGSSGAVARAAIEKPSADRVLAAIVAARCPPPSRLVPHISPFFDRVLSEALAREAERRPSASELAQRYTEGETGTWWRSTLDFTQAAGRSAAAEAESRALVPLVGRETMLERLEEAWTATSDGLRLALILGGAGMGKSRLVSEFIARLRTRMDPPLYLYARCREAEEVRAGQPMLRLLERFLRLPSGARPTVREREELDHLVPPRVTQTLLALLASEEVDSSEASAMAAPVALAAWLTALSRARSVCIHLDDAHKADDDTLETLRLWAREAPEARALLLLGLRGDGDAHDRAPGEGPIARLAAQLPTTTLELAPLSEDDVLLMVKRLFHHGAPRLRLAYTLWQRSRGNPGLIVELLRGLVSRAEARPHPDGGGLELAIAPEALPLPKSLRKAIEDSYKALPALNRAWLRRLAVVGGRMEVEFLLACFPGTARADLDQLLARFVRLGWLVVSGSRYRFSRPALREALYRTLSKEQRERLHAAAAAALQAESNTIEGSYQRAFHLRSAGAHVELLDELPSLVAQLLRSGQPQRVAPLARWGLEAVDAVQHSESSTPSSTGDKLRIRLLEAAADAADRLGTREDQRELLEKLAQLDIDPSADPESAGRVYLLHGRYAVATGQYGLARGLYKNAVDLLERAGAQLEHSEALRRLSAVQSHVGNLVDARGLAERARDRAVVAPQRALALLQLATVGVLEDRLEASLEQTEEALRLLRSDTTWSLPGALAGAHLVRSRVYKSAGDIARALAAARQALDLARAAGERRLLCETTARLGWLMLDIDRPEEAQALLREAQLLAREIEDRRGEALSTLFLGILLWEVDDPEALLTIESAEQMAADLGLARVAQLAIALRARIEHASGNHAQALETSERAIHSMERHGAEWNDRVVIVGTHAMCLRSADRPKPAKEAERALRRQLDRENKALVSPALRDRHRRRSEALIAAVISPEGPVYPRVHLP